jgi:hypothetical protein
MKALSSPAGLAIVALLLAAATHPAVDLAWLGSASALAVPLLALLLALAAVLAARGRGVPGIVVALGMVVTLAGVGHDALRGRSGRLTLRPQEGTQTFEEEGPGGRVLGLRPLGFDLRLPGAGPEGATLAIGVPAPTSPAVAIGPREAVAENGLRLGWRAYEDSPRLVLTLSRGDERLELELSGTAPLLVEDAEIQLVRYFPDFAIDAANQPYSRSTDFRNPGALLRVRRAGTTRHIFVLRSVSGPQEFNQLPELGWTFGLASMTADPRLTLGVHQEPAAAAVAFGVALVVVGLALGMRR